LKGKEAKNYLKVKCLVSIPKYSNEWLTS
jgi:hypothetical protein